MLRRPVILDRTKHFPFVLMRFHGTISAVTQVCQVSYGARCQSTAQCEATIDVRCSCKSPCTPLGTADCPFLADLDLPNWICWHSLGLSACPGPGTMSLSNEGKKNPNGHRAVTHNHPPPPTTHPYTNTKEQETVHGTYRQSPHTRKSLIADPATDTLQEEALVVLPEQSSVWL